AINKLPLNPPCSAISRAKDIISKPQLSVINNPSSKWQDLF
ncbi:MAG: hypothetical protein ACJAU1_000597, partial [Psychromonas sp.]